MTETLPLDTIEETDLGTPYVVLVLGGSHPDMWVAVGAHGIMVDAEIDGETARSSGTFIPWEAIDQARRRATELEREATTRKLWKYIRKLWDNRFYQIAFYPPWKWVCEVAFERPTVHNWVRLIVWLPFASVAVSGWIFWGKRPEGTG